MTTLLILLVVTLGAVWCLRLLVRWTAVSASPFDVEPWLSGHRPVEHALSRYHARWYTASVVFLAFDVEMVFMYPGAVVVGHIGPGAVVEMFSFLMLLLLGVGWARGSGESSDRTSR